MDAPVAKETVEVLAARKGLSALEVRCARALMCWPLGKEVSEEELDAAVQAAKEVVVR